MVGLQQRCWHYSGHVQGVGFRQTCCAIAANLTVSGYVQNLADRRVKMVAQGTKEELDSLQQEVAERMAGFIREVTCEVAAPSQSFVGFQIRY